MPIVLADGDVLRNAVRDRSASGEIEDARDHRHVQAVRRTDRYASERGRAAGPHGDFVGRRAARRRASRAVHRRLGHDLRNPLASLQAGLRLLLKARRPEKTAEIFGMMQNSIMRMSKLVDNVMDFARGRLGGGLTLDLSPEHLATALTQVIDEVRSSYPDSASKATSRRPRASGATVHASAQLFSNFSPMRRRTARRTGRSRSTRRQRATTSSCR